MPFKITTNNQFFYEVGNNPTEEQLVDYITKLNDEWELACTVLKKLYPNTRRKKKKPVAEKEDLG